MSNDFNEYVHAAGSFLEKLKKFRKDSLCNKRQVVSSILFQEEDTYEVFTNGDAVDPCTEKGPDYCKRHGEPNGVANYVCDSKCAEGYAIEKAHVDGKNFKDSILFSTDLPCPRCAQLIEGAGIKTVLFSDLKNGHEYGRGDFLVAYKLPARGIELIRVYPIMNGITGEIEYDSEKFAANRFDQIRERGMKIKPLENWLSEMNDPEFKERQAEILREHEKVIREREDHWKNNPDTVEKFLLSLGRTNL